MTPKSKDLKQVQNHAHLLSLANQWLGHSEQTTLFTESKKSTKKQKKSIA